MRFMTTNPFLQGSVKAARNNAMKAKAGDGGFSAKMAFSKSITGLIMVLITIMVILNTELINIIEQYYTLVIIIDTIILVMLGTRALKDLKKAKSSFYLYNIALGVIISFFIKLSIQDYPGIIQQALVITFLIIVVMYILYNNFPKIIQTAKGMIATATAVVAMLFSMSFLFSLFGIRIINYNSPFFILFILIVASFSITLEFQAIDQMEKSNSPKDGEYLAAIGMVTSVLWIFVNVVKLLTVLKRENNR